MLVKEYNKRMSTLDPVKSVDELIVLGWFDWFCTNKSLMKRNDAIADLLCGLSAPKVSSMYVYFKNCCPVSGPLYDMIGIKFTEDGQTDYTICLGDKRDVDTCVLYGRVNDFKEPIVVGRRAVIAYLNNL